RPGTRFRALRRSFERPAVFRGGRGSTRVRYLGIDGGGSKTAFLLVDEYYNELCHIHTGPSNWISVGKETVQAAIHDGLSQQTEPPDVICGGFAGAARAEGAAFYKEVLSSLLPKATVII